jgi:dienelactone hydrolase
MKKASRVFCFVLLALLALQPATGGSTPVEVPWDLAKLSASPAVFPSNAIQSTDPRIRALFFAGPDYRGKPTRVFAWLGVPAGEPGTKVPGIVLLHGGGGTAFESWVKLWVDRGYAAIAIDAFGNLPVPEDAKPRPRNPDGGPPGGSTAFEQLADPPHDQWPFHAVSAAILAHSLLRIEPGVDPDRIGVTGISWGGYLTCIMASVDSRLKFAAPVYGCGHYEDTTFAGALAKRPAQESALWYEQWDAANYLPQARLPMLWCTGTNDRFFGLPAWRNSHRQPPAELRTLALRVGMKHGHPPDGDPPEILAFADSIVRGGDPLPVVETPKQDGLVVTAAYRSARRIVRAELNYTDAGEGSWEKRTWQTVPAVVNRDTVTAQLPPEACVFYLNLIDDRGCIVSTEHSVKTKDKVLPAPA